MKDSEIHVGDVLRIREWDDMANEFEVDECGDIRIPKPNMPAYFLYSNKYMCGQIFTVKEIRTTFCICYRSEENVEGDQESSFGFYYTITCDMLEPFTDDEYELATDDDIRILLG